MFYVSIIQNTSLLISLIVVYGLVMRRSTKKTISHSLISGLLFGAVAVLVMASPVRVAPGIIFDSRSIVMIVAGLFGGPFTAAIAVSVATAYRLWLGGAGTTHGVVLIVQSACFGSLWYFLRRRSPKAVHPLSLLALGFIVHVIMLFHGLSLPREQAVVPYRLAVFTALLLHPAATVLVSRLFLELEKRIASERALRASESLYHSLVQHVPQYIFRKDLTGRYTFASGQFCANLGLSLEEVIGRTDWDFWPPNLAAKYRDDDLRVMQSGQTLSCVEEYRPPGQDTRIVETTKTPIRDDDGTITGIQGIFSDITERNRKEIERERLVTAIDQAAEAVIITDTDGIIHYVNPAFERASGYPSADAVGSKPSILRSGEHDDAFYQELWRTIAAGKTWQGRLVNKKKDGSLYTEEATITPVRNASGKVVNYVAVKRDITNELEMESRLRHAQKLEAIGTLAGGIAHDFNNILSAILGYAELASAQVEEHTRLHDYLAEVERASRRGAELVEQILTLSRKKQRQRQTLLLPPIVRSTARMLRNTLPTTIGIHLTIDEDCPHVDGDETEIQQILLNLCTNAFHAMRRNGGLLTIELGPVTLSALDGGDSHDVEPGEYARIAVIDTGHGMDDETVRHIFDPYFTTKEVGQGTGLGLATVHGIVQGCHGTIHVTSRPTRGTMFEVFLPASAEPLSEPPATEQALSPEPHGGRILIVDDEESVAKVESFILDRAGFDTLSFTDPLEALAAFSEDPASFDLVLTDQTMPRKTGVVLSRELMAIRPDIPIVLCTGHSEMIDEEEALATGIRAFLTKPTRSQDLLTAIQNAMTRSPSADP